MDNPRSVGEALHGSELGEFWKYRVGDYRLISKIEDDRVLVLVLRIGHRKDIYPESTSEPVIGRPCPPRSSVLKSAL